MPKPCPREFGEDVIAVARRGEAPLKQLAKDFGGSEGCLANWLRAAEVEDGTRPGVAREESAELRELRKRIQRTLAVRAVNLAVHQGNRTVVC